MRQVNNIVNINIFSLKGYKHIKLISVIKHGV